MMVIPGNTPRPSGAWINPAATRRCALTLPMSAPSNQTEPDVSGSSPEIARIMVVFPAPLEPSSVTSSPSCTTSETPCRARIRP